MKKITKFFSCFLFLFSSFFAFPACNSQANNDETGYKPLPKIEEYFQPSYEWTESLIEQYGEWNTAIKKSHPNIYEGEGFGGVLVATQTVKIKKISASCGYNGFNIVEIEGKDFVSLLPDTWTTTIYTENFTLTKGESWWKQLTMTHESNPDLPAVMEAGDEIHFLMCTRTDGKDVHFSISNLSIDIITEEYPNGVRLQ